LRARAQEKGVSIAGPAIEMMAKTVGSNLWIMSNELEKLTLYAAGRQIETADVELLGGYSQQQKIFSLVDAIVEGKTESATRQLEQTLQSGASPSYVMAMLARQMRLIVTARELKAQRVPMLEARGRLANSPEFAVQRLFKQSADYSLPRLRLVYQLMTEADQSIKTGRSEPEMAVGMLVSELCRKGA
jgi:DNA polymerase-3 subunit delta